MNPELDLVQITQHICLIRAGVGGNGPIQDLRRIIEVLLRGSTHARGSLDRAIASHTDGLGHVDRARIHRAVVGVALAARAHNEGMGLFDAGLG